MATVLVTGSTTGLGAEAARLLAGRGHRVVWHARTAQRAAELPGSAETVVGDLASLAQTRDVAAQADKYGPFDAVIHNAGISEPGGRVLTEDGLEQTFQVNVLAPYVLTALIPLPRRLIYLTSGMADGGTIALDDLQRERRRWNATAAYCDSKLADLALAYAVARRLPRVVSTAVCPGWVRTRMGGSGAPTDVRTGAETQAWLAVSDDERALRTGGYWRHMRPLPALPGATDQRVQDGLIAACAELSGVPFPL
ncbi:short-subunit dehydrogenase [Krasilnikovia cinnamomea]|uniref:Short-subunit dehydrogenase n=1 Tax=Krasilnikovia cinnamomea TaxID=349313 RepID=A0A4Q7ZLD4_9ACTN|nr:SDR family NAD(P)-dependent oxidoreductase [Krasilnikovia cinnamomea]RZU51401.1 short-subunit dehydrogenase [Krasilnikovia cinnamomea]